MLPNGYLTWFDPERNLLQQVCHFGAPKITTLRAGSPGGNSLTGALSLRTFMDGMTRPLCPLTKIHERSAIVTMRDERNHLIQRASESRASLYLSAASHSMKILAAQASAKVPSREDARTAMLANLNHVAPAGVLSVRPSLQLGSPRRKEASYSILVTAMPESVGRLQAVIPTAIDGVPVQLRSATVLQEMRAESPAKFMMLAGARHELREPGFPDEIFFDG